MSWLCGGSGVSNENTIEAGRQALAHRRWDRSKQLFDKAWKRDPDTHQTIIDICEDAVDEATAKFNALGDGPAHVPLEETPGVEPDKAAIARYQKEVAARKKEYQTCKEARRSKLNRLHGIAKHYNKRLMQGLEEPTALGGLCTHIALHHKALSATAPRGYDPKHNQRACDYFSRAIAVYDQAHLPQSQPIAGRMDVVADRLMHTTQRWYETHHRQKLQDATGLLLQDFVSLVSLPTTHEERLQNLETLALLLQRKLPVASHEFILHEVMAPLSEWLINPSEEASAIRLPVLRVFEQLINHQEWAKHDAGAALHAFVADGNLELTLEHMQVLYPCYRGLIDGNSKDYGRYDVLPDFDILRGRMAHNEKALVQLLVLLDDVVRFGSSRHTLQAAEMVRAIGMDTQADNVQYSALIILDHLASFNDRATHAPVALDDMATLIGGMKNEHLRDYGIVRIAFHNAHPARLEAAHHALYTTLGLDRNDVEKLLLHQEDVYKNISAIEANSATVAL